MSKLFLQVEIPEGEPPDEFVIFKAGDNPTSKGVLVFDETAASLVMAELKEQGMDRLPFDAGHGMFAFIPTPENQKALGWFVAVVRDGQLVATDIQFTPFAREALKNREFRFFSPAVEVKPLNIHDEDEDEREIVPLAEQRFRVTALLNVALTNMPATKNQEPLVATHVARLAPPCRGIDPVTGKVIGHRNDPISVAQAAEELVGFLGQLSTPEPTGPGSKTERQNQMLEQIIHTNSIN